MNPQFIFPRANTIQANSIVNALTQTLIKAPKPLKNAELYVTKSITKGKVDYVLKFYQQINELPNRKYHLMGSIVVIRPTRR